MVSFNKRERESCNENYPMEGNDLITFSKDVSQSIGWLKQMSIDMLISSGLSKSELKTSCSCVVETVSYIVFKKDSPLKIYLLPIHNCF